MLQRIEAFLKTSGMVPSRFGRTAVQDGLFVSQLRRGRVPRPHTQARVNAFLDRAERELGVKRRRRRP